MPATEYRRDNRAHSIGLVAVVAVLGLAPLHLAAQLAVALVVTGPIESRGSPGDVTHDYVFHATPMDLARVGYVEQEYFLAGTATRYGIPVDGSSATSPGTMPYRTRLVVRRPANVARFSGVVI